jgi:hypothetical protein
LYIPRLSEKNLTYKARQMYQYICLNRKVQECSGTLSPTLIFTLTKLCCKKTVTATSALLVLATLDDVTQPVLFLKLCLHRREDNKYLSLLLPMAICW